jgi:hypothetical protein
MLYVEGRLCLRLGGLRLGRLVVLFSLCAIGPAILEGQTVAKQTMPMDLKSNGEAYRTLYLTSLTESAEAKVVVQFEFPRGWRVPSSDGMIEAWQSIGLSKASAKTGRLSAVSVFDVDRWHYLRMEEFQAIFKRRTAPAKPPRGSLEKQQNGVSCRSLNVPSLAGHRTDPAYPDRSEPRS